MPEARKLAAEGLPPRGDLRRLARDPFTGRRESQWAFPLVQPARLNLALRDPQVARAVLRPCVLPAESLERVIAPVVHTPLHRRTRHRRARASGVAVAEKGRGLIPNRWRSEDPPQRAFTMPRAAFYLTRF